VKKIAGIAVVVAIVAFTVYLVIRIPKPVGKAEMPVEQNAQLGVSEEWLGIFIQEQEQIRRLADDSVLPVLELDLSDDDVPRAADRVADWMEETGKLYMES